MLKNTHFTLLLFLVSACYHSFEEPSTKVGLKNYPNAKITVSHKDKGGLITESGHSRGENYHMHIGNLKEVIKSFLPEPDIVFDDIYNERIVKLDVRNVPAKELPNISEEIFEQLSKNLDIKIERKEIPGDVLILEIVNEQKVLETKSKGEIRRVVNFVGNNALYIGDLNDFRTYLAKDLLEDQIIFEGNSIEGNFKFNFSEIELDHVIETLYEDYGLSLRKEKGLRDVIYISPK